MEKAPLITVLVVYLAALLGCAGQDNEDLVECRGRVSFRGQPVPKGRIEFMPDVSKGNKGPAGYALIEAGQYNTSHQGRGAVAGAQVIRVQGFDGVPVSNEGGEMGSALFPAYQTTIEIVQGKSQHDFEIP
jgi:hypothetical protein